MVTEEASARSLANASQRQRDIDRCCAEVAEIEALLRAGHPDIQGLCLALVDWSAELRLLEASMDKQILQFLIPGIGLISGLIATYVSLQNRALLAEVRKELAELENKIFIRVNGTYVRSQECHLREEAMHARMEALVLDVSARATAGLLRDETVQARITKLVEDIGLRTISGLLREEIVLTKLSALAAEARGRIHTRQEALPEEEAAAGV